MVKFAPLGPLPGPTWLQHPLQGQAHLGAIFFYRLDIRPGRRDRSRALGIRESKFVKQPRSFCWWYVVFLFPRISCVNNKSHFVKCQFEISKWWIANRPTLFTIYKPFSFHTHGAFDTQTEPETREPLIKTQFPGVPYPLQIESPLPENTRLIDLIDCMWLREKVLHPMMSVD